MKDSDTAIARRDPKLPGLVAEDLAEAFLSRRSPNTRRAYDSDLRPFARFAGEPSPASALDGLIALGPGRARHD